LGIGFTASPLSADHDFVICWDKLSNAVPGRDRKEINAPMVLVTRRLWLERNNMVFDKFVMMHLKVCRKIRVELE
jgi:hypothetical protein